MRILAIDDDPVFLELLAGMLKMIGYAQVTTMPSGDEALHELDFSGMLYDCILSDMQMPDMDGAALTAAIRSRTAYRQTPVLMITANYSNELKLQIRELGHTLMHKPVRPMKLKTAMSHLLARP